MIVINPLVSYNSFDYFIPVRPLHKNSTVAYSSLFRENVRMNFGRTNMSTNVTHFGAIYCSTEFAYFM